jgi:hypothetical protein
MATPEEEIPLRHLPLDVLRLTIARRERALRDVAPLAPEEPPGEVDALLASVGLRVRAAPADDLEPLRGELARRIGEGREVARQRSALYRAHRSVGLLEYRAKPTVTGIARFIAHAGERLYDEAGAPPLYLLVPTSRWAIVRALYVPPDAAQAAPIVLGTPFGPVKIAESTLVEWVTLI